MAAAPGQMAGLVQLLAQTVSSNAPAMQAAEQQLRSGEVQAGFGLMLLELLRNTQVDPSVRQAGAIYFKNYVRRQWTVESGGISASDRQAIKQHLLTLMLQAPKPVQVQLAAGLEEISITDYPAEWQSLLPEMVQHLKTSHDIQVLKGTMETAHAVFAKFRRQARSDDLLREIKFTVLGFQETHLTVFKAACERVLSGALPADQLVAYFGLLHATIGVFFSLNVVDLPEFFQDHIQEYFKGLLELLKFQHEAVQGRGDQQGLLEQVKGEICDCLALYTDKYQEEFSPFLVPSVTAVWTLLVGLSQQEMNDQLVARGIKFLSSAAWYQWPQNPFTDPAVLSGICEKVVFPNIVLRDSDVELFEENPLEYVRRDMESADQDTRRRSSMDLVKAMGRLNEAKVTEILIGYIKALMEQSRTLAGDKAERCKDACLYLCIAMAVKGQTQREGVTVTNPNVNVVDFFTNIVAPELNSEPISQHSILRASCLKFTTVFRNQLPRDQVGSVIAAICRHILSPSPVVHTYAAICMEKLLSVRDRPPAGGPAVLRYDAASMRPSLLGMVDPILRLIASQQGIPQNEYLMRVVAKIFSHLKELGGESGLATLRPLSQILVAMSANPSNPVFNHNLFEAIASIVKVCVPARPDQVEQTLLPVLGQLLERNVTDFLPYTFQILGLLLDATTTVKPLYQELFTRLLTVELWRARANVPGLVRLMRAYFAKHSVFAALLEANGQTIMERLQLLLYNRKTETTAFDLLNAMYLHLPVAFYQRFFKTLVTVVLTRLQSSKSPKFQKDCTVSLSLFVHRCPDAAYFPAVLTEIQAGLLTNLLSGIWLPAARMALRLDERKVVTVALAKLMSCDEVRQNAQALSSISSALVVLLGLLPSTTKVLDAEENSDDEVPDGGAGLEYEASFSKLRNTDLPGAAAGLAPDVPDLASAAKTLLQPHRSSILQLAHSNVELQPLAMFLQ